ncbi:MULTISPECIES: rod shape-determining protein MreD [unclassified Flavobacterium]|uniref:rod shape-determining protein MreD n=1 Tax=unclassified Flavobacterium TaxID=196869 RepID=UPI0013D6D264|nr:MULTISPECIES: rod shape-determining protein MreD [unclassified Flavobacterium]MBA5792460.1 rod shape-determining protein MreD [Flavobacterium sp. xlx-221]
MNNTTILNTFRFIVLVFFQVTVFNNIHLFGFITPYPYILFILLYPLNSNRHLFLLFSFLLGLILDTFNNSGGVHTTACITLAFFRENLLKMAFGYSYEYHMMRITDKISSELITYVVTSVLIHHTILVSLEIFNFSFILEILLRIVTSAAFTILLLFLIIGFIKSPKK